MLRFLLSAVFALVVALPAFAAQEISWDDLAQPIPDGADPYVQLDWDSRISLDTLVATEATRLAGWDLTEEEKADEAAALAQLSEAGFDGADLLERERAFQNYLASGGDIMREEWAGVDVRIPGFIIPLAYQGMTATEFLLVPYVGACIHTPPPPANQMIVVRFSDGYEFRDLFEPVWVSGPLLLESSNRSVGLSDGTSDFNVGYALEASDVTVYSR